MRQFNWNGSKLAAIETPSASRSALRVSSRRAELAIVAALVLLATGLRLIPILVSPSLNWADEVFQATEQAHRLVYGTGLVPWEFQLGIRSWVLPGVIAGLMEAARLLGDGPEFYLPVIAVAFALLGTAPVVCCYLWCRRFFGLSGAVIGALVVAVAPELVYFGGRTLVDAVAAHLLIVALYILAPGYPVSGRRRLYLGGLLVGFLFVLRVQLAPVLALLTVWIVPRVPRAERAALAVGAVTAVLVLALLDTVTLGAPLASVWRYVSYNVFYGVSTLFGTEPWNYYIGGEFGIWQGAIVALVGLALIGAWRLPGLLVCAVVIIATHSLIAHKEYRFIYPAIVLLAVLSGIGLAQLAAWGRDWLQTRRPRWDRGAVWLSSGLAVGYWCILALQIWLGPMAPLLDRDHDYLMAANLIVHQSDVCGIGLFGRDGKDWGWSGGYTYLHHPVPIYWPKDQTEFAATAAGFDTLIYYKKPPQDSRFVTQQCFGTVCVARRPGRCARIPMMAMPFPDSLAQFVPAHG